METTNKILAGTILVCINNQATGCGIKYLDKGSIVKCAKDCQEHRETVEVYRNENEMALGSWKAVNRNKLRLATPEESQMYYEGKYFLEPVESE